MDIKLTNQNLISYARTEDAHEAFVNSVGNGQARLALEVLVDLIDGMIEKIEELEAAVGISSSDSSEEIADAPQELPEVEQPAVVTPVEEPVVAEAVTEEVKPKPKSTKADSATEKAPDAEV